MIHIDEFMFATGIENSYPLITKDGDDLMYGAPQLAPLALAVVGDARSHRGAGCSGQASVAGLDLRAALLAVVAVAVALTGAVLQAGILHYRGAFNNGLMNAPLTVPLLAVAASAWAS